MKEQFNDWVPGKPKTKALLQNVQAIIESYSAQDIRLSLRQLYYQLVARALIPNNERSYKRLGDLVTKARYGGLIDWEMIVDHGRVAITPSEWRDPAHIIETGIRSYRLPRWADQDYHLEVWCEKDALTTVLEPITNRYHVSLLAHTGFSSSTALYHAAKRFQEIEEGGRHPVVLYLGDHDPSGLDMFRDIKNRLDILSWSCAIENLRLALTYGADRALPAAAEPREGVGLPRSRIRRRTRPRVLGT